MDIRLLGAHNCESQATRLTSLLIDDSLALDAGGLTSSLSFPAQQKIRAILLTHQHYDHIRDVPVIAVNLYLSGAAINIYSILPVYNALKTHLLDGEIYPNFLERPRENPAIKFTEIEPLKPMQIGEYNILAVPVSHAVPAVGYQITSPDGKAMFYTGDTGPGLSECWKQVSPQLLVIEVTANNEQKEFASESGHFTPDLLKQELLVFQKLKGYLPQVVVIHMNPRLEEEIKAELDVVSRELNSSIVPGYEGMLIHL